MYVLYVHVCGGRSTCVHGCIEARDEGATGPSCLTATPTLMPPHLILQGCRDLNLGPLDAAVSVDLIQSIPVIEIILVDI